MIKRHTGAPPMIRLSIQSEKYQRCESINTVEKSDLRWPMAHVANENYFPNYANVGKTQTRLTTMHTA
jgi:hypothetical protein